MVILVVKHITIAVAQHARQMQICVDDGTPGRIGGTGEVGIGNTSPRCAPDPASAFKPMPAPEGPTRQPPAAPPESRDSQRPWPGLDRLGWLQAIGGLFLGLIALYGLRPATPTPLMTTSPSPAQASSCNSSGDPFSSLPRWRQWLSNLCHTARHLGATLNWRPVREIEQRTRELEIEIAQLRAENARSRALNASIQRLCFPPESSSTPPPPTEPDCGPSSP